MTEKKQFQPTQKRILEAKGKGNIPRSTILTKGIGLLVIVSVFSICERFCWEENKLLLQYTLGVGFRHPIELFKIWTSLFVKSTGVVFGISIFAIILSELMQVGFHLNFNLLVPDFGRLSPLKGWQRMVEGISQILEIGFRILIVLMAYWLFQLERVLAGFVSSNLLDPPFSGAIVEQLHMGLVVSSISVIGIGIVEYLLKRRKFFIEQSMSVEEIRQELKDSEGNPEVKGWRNLIYRELLNQDLIRRVRNSKVIVPKSG